jgi:hypothetical protein
MDALLEGSIVVFQALILGWCVDMLNGTEKKMSCQLLLRASLGVQKPEEIRGLKPPSYSKWNKKG